MENDNISDMKKGLKSLKPDPAKMSNAKKIAAMIDEIIEARDRGVTYEQIQAYLNENGIKVGLSTMKSYITDAKKNSQKTMKKRLNVLAAKSEENDAGDNADKSTDLDGSDTI